MVSVSWLATLPISQFWADDGLGIVLMFREVAEEALDKLGNNGATAAPELLILLVHRKD